MQDAENAVAYYSSPRDFINFHDQLFRVNSSDQIILDALEIEIESSYTQNSFSELFYFLTRFFQPSTVSEFGVLGCYSIISMALGSKNYKNSAEIIGHDLFEDYKYNAFAYADAKERVKKFNLESIINFNKCNALKGDLIEYSLRDNDLTHIDLSNEGNLFTRVLSADFKKNSITVLEGGSIDRDKSSWISKYGALEISPVIKSYAKKRPELKISVINAYPSVTIIQS